MLRRLATQTISRLSSYFNSNRRSRLSYYLLFSLPFFLYYHGSPYLPKWTLGLMVCVLWLSYELAAKIHWSLFLPVSLPLLSSVFIAESNLHNYMNLHHILQMAMRESAARGGLSFLIIVLTLSLIPYRKLRFFRDYLSILCVVNAVVVVVEKFYLDQTPFHLGGVLGNASMNGCFIAVTYPFLLFRIKRECWRIHDIHKSLFLPFLWAVLPPLAVVLTESHMAVGTFIVALLSYLWSYYGLRVYTVAKASLFLGLIFYFFMGFSHLFNTSGRMAVWQGVMTYWYEHKGYFFGSGTGTAVRIIQYIQGAMNIDTGVDRHQFYWLHSDVLQILFENGALAFAGYFILYSVCLKKSFNTPHLFAATTGYLAMSFGNYPARMFVHAFLGALIVALVLRKNVKAS